MESFDVVEDIRSCFRSSLILPSVDALSLQQAEEAFSRCVVSATADLAHAALKLMILQEPLIFVTRKLTATIGVKHNWALVGALPQCHQDGLQHELGVLVSAHGPANHTTGVEVHHNGQVEPAFGSSDVRDVGDPLGVGFIRAEVSSQVIANMIRPSSRWLCSPLSPLRNAAKTILSHQASHAVAAARFAQVAQLVPHARASENSIAFRVKASNANQQPIVRLSALACRPTTPTVVAAW